jgi:hypothetical protein
MVQTCGQYSQYFFLKAYENRGVLILRPDSWHERPWSINTPRRWDVLKAVSLCKIQQMSLQDVGQLKNKILKKLYPLVHF